MINKDAKIYIAGHTGLVGSAIIKNLNNKGFNNIITRTHQQLDLTNQSKVRDFFDVERPDQVYLAAGKVGGIYANNAYPANFIYTNLMIESNVINSSYETDVKKLLFLGSSCIYPRNASQPMSESELLTNTLEVTNEPYAIAKIAGIKLCESYNRQYGASNNIDYRSVVPTNLYGPGDNYHPENSHVIPALILRLHEAKLNNSPSVAIWGTGKPRREFLYIDDLADACVYIMNINKQKYIKHTKSMLSHVNVGAGYDITINELAQTIKKVVGYEGDIDFDNTKPDGSPQKLLDSSLINDLGWSSSIEIKKGLTKTYKAFQHLIKK